MSALDDGIPLFLFSLAPYVRGILDSETLHKE